MRLWMRSRDEDIIFTQSYFQIEISLRSYILAINITTSHNGQSTIRYWTFQFMNCYKLLRLDEGGIPLRFECPRGEYIELCDGASDFTFTSLCISASSYSDPSHTCNIFICWKVNQYFVKSYLVSRCSSNNNQSDNNKDENTNNPFQGNVDSPIFHIFRRERCRHVVH